jgi:hypothetical protein
MKKGVRKRNAYMHDAKHGLPAEWWNKSPPSFLVTVFSNCILARSDKTKNRYSNKKIEM